MIGKISLHDKLFDQLHAIVVRHILTNKITQKELSNIAGVSPAFICQILKKGDEQKRFFPSLVRLADALNIEVSLTLVDQ